MLLYITLLGHSLSCHDILTDYFLFIISQPKPRIDYTLKAVGGSLTAIPGLSDMIDVISMITLLLYILFVNYLKVGYVL